MVSTTPWKHQTIEVGVKKLSLLIPNFLAAILGLTIAL